MKVQKIHNAEDMIALIREMGIIPLFRGKVPGWSIEEMTDPGCWFTTSDQLGPWDWKINAVQEGDIAFGKFLGGKAAFATVECYAHLMNCRRSLPKYRVALGEKAAAALELVKKQGEATSREIRMAISEAENMTVKKSVSDTVIQFLEMGTWIVTGDIRRVYRGPNLEYKGWQEASLTTPDSLFAGAAADGSGRDAAAGADAPFWAKMFEDDMKNESGCAPLYVDCTPEESREWIIAHILHFFPDWRADIEKVI